MTTDADLCALWSAWLRDRTLHRGCNLVAAIMRATVERRPTEPYPPQIRPPQIVHDYRPDEVPAGLREACDHRKPQDDFGRRAPKKGAGAKIIEGLRDAAAYAQGDVAAAARVRIVPRRRAVEAWEDGPPVDPTIEAGDSA